MNSLTKNRIGSIDLLKGFVMVIMALDHVRDYFHYSAYIFDPADPTQSTLPLFLTRFITHFCAPTFCFLAGTSAYMSGKRKTKNELSIYLLQRGVWLVCVELFIVTFGWLFDFHFGILNTQVIWSLGISMIFLAGLIHLPRKYILIFSLVMIGGHNLFDNIHYNGNVIWSILHEPNNFIINKYMQFSVAWPIIPWVAVMSLGYYFGAFYDKSYDVKKRKKIFTLIGLISISLFLVLRYTNLYGDLILYKDYGSISKNIISFFNPSKYPPSLLYLLMTLGVAFFLLANIEKLNGKIVNFFSTFGRVPFFYYILHLYVIHLSAIVMYKLTGFGWKNVLPSWGPDIVPSYMKGYGYSLWVVYAVWVGIILFVYPICLRYDKYKQAHKEKWWLSYL
jgi:uncharacterized membrane protein